MSRKMVSFYVNEHKVETEISMADRLLDILREKLGLMGTKEGCGTGECGACTVIMNGKVVNSCMVPAASLQPGDRILTIEGLQKGETLHPIQEAFARHNAIQCGFCTPGLVMSTKALLDENPHPTRDQISRAIVGNLCRCTGYEQVVDAIEDVSNGDDNNDNA